MFGVQGLRFHLFKAIFMATIKHFEDIEAWQLARQMCVEIHEITLQGAFGNDFSL
jgi:hypothetical protein